MHQGAPPGEKILQNGLVFPADFVRLGCKTPAEGCEHFGIDGIRLFELAHGPGKLSGALRVDDSGGNARLKQHGGQTPVIASGGFDHDQADLGVSKLLDEVEDGSLVVVEREMLGEGVDENIQLVLGDIDTGNG